MNILKRIKHREMVPGTLSCPICNFSGDRYHYDKWYHHHNCMSVIQQMFGRFTSASAKELAKEICSHELFRPNTEHGKETTRKNMECVHKLILRYGGTEKEWKLVEKEVHKILKTIAPKNKVNEAVKKIKVLLKGFTYKQKESIMYQAIGD